MESITITKTFNAPVAKLWSAWTDPTQFPKWFGPDENSVHLRAYAVENGKAYDVDVVEPSGAIHTTTGVFTEVVPMEKIVMTWKIADLPMDESIITVTFAERDGKTTLTLLQERLGTDMLREVHTQGWNSAFVKLEGVVA